MNKLLMKLRRFIQPEYIKNISMSQHLLKIHQARITMVKKLLPQANLILDLGGGNCPLHQMGYSHKFKKISIIELPVEERDFYKDICIDTESAFGVIEMSYSDMTELSNYNDSSIDMVWSGQSIEHLPVEAGMKMCLEAYRVLKKGGSFCLDTPNRYLTEIHTRTIGGGYIHPEHFIEYYPEDLIRILTKAGFVIKNSYGICEMLESTGTNEFKYEDFLFGKKISKYINRCYIQYYHCVK